MRVRFPQGVQAPVERVELIVRGNTQAPVERVELMVRGNTQAPVERVELICAWQYS
jgi:hypothetical protein